MKFKQVHKIVNSVDHRKKSAIRSLGKHGDTESALYSLNDACTVCHSHLPPNKAKQIFEHRCQTVRG